MKPTTQIVHGGSDKTNGDFTLIHQLAKRKGTDWWGCGKETKIGDKLLIYFEQPHSAIVASGVALTHAEPGEHHPFIARVGKIEILHSPITLHEMQRMFPRWKWLNYPRAKQYLDETRAGMLIERANLKLNTPPVAIRVSGVGFGTAEQNRAVEQAACKAVRKFFENRGYQVVSREKLNLGYDFDVSRSDRALHVEVKGISGTLLRFPITANEVARARTDSLFQLAAVTEATTSKRRVHVFTRTQFLNRFGLKPLAYLAEAKNDSHT